MPAVAHRRNTSPITCCLDGLAHDVSDENVAARDYLALCGYRVLPAPMAAPLGRPCAGCTAASATAPAMAPARRSHRRRPRWLWRKLHPGHPAGASAQRLP